MWWRFDSEIGPCHQNGVGLCYSSGMSCIIRPDSASNDGADDDADEISRPHFSAPRVKSILYKLGEITDKLAHSLTAPM